jgi:hypothetical protein
LPHFQAPEAVAVDALGNAVFSDEPTNRLMRVYWAGLKLIHISSHFHHIFITFHHISSRSGSDLLLLLPCAQFLLAQGFPWKFPCGMSSCQAHDIKISSLGLCLDEIACLFPLASHGCETL